MLVMTGESNNILRGPPASPLLEYKGSDRDFFFVTKLSFIRAKSLPPGGGFMTTVKATKYKLTETAGGGKLKLTKFY